MRKKDRVIMFDDRKSAGLTLAEVIKKFAQTDTVILALPRGGVPVGAEISQKLHLPLDVIIVRKIGAPGHEEFGVGAISEGNVLILDKSSIRDLKISEIELNTVIEKERKELERRVEKYRTGKPLSLKNKTVILVDDGLATGITAKAAIKRIKKFHPKKIIFALPVCAQESVDRIKKLVDELICLACPEDFKSVGQWYRNFHQMSDDEVIEILSRIDKED